MITLDLGNSAATTGGASSTSRESGVPQKLQRTDGRQHIPNVVPPKGRVATLTRISGGQRQVSIISLPNTMLMSNGCLISEYGKNIMNEKSFLNDTVEDSIFRAIFVL